MTEVGAIVGDRYHIVGELGRGGMGVVYLGRDLRRDMDVAIKLCGRKSADAMLWLKREFRVVASLRHPNLVELFELVAHERSCYFTMEYVVGIDPRRYVQRPPAEQLVHEETTSTLAPLRAIATRTSDVTAVPDVDFGRARSVLAQLAEALAFLHARGVVHRDVKPSNVLVANGQVKLLDFGLALERARIDEEVAREMRIVGTAAYLAPEYVEKLVVTPAVDVYALGVLAFNLVAGISPFGDMPSLKRERRALMVPRASRINPDVPRDLDDLIDEMLSQNPARRPTALHAAMRLAGSLSSPRSVRRAGHFVGRNRELDQLARHLADPAPRARFVVVTGPSGVGKTALVEEALGRARLAGTLPQLVWRGRCHERELVPFRAFDFVVDDLAAELAHDDELADTIEHTGALARVFPALGATLDESEPAAGDLRVERERALIAMTQLFDRVIGAQHGVIVIDDLQWADADSLELLAMVVARVTRPLAIIATWSDDEAAAQRLATIVERLGAAAEILELAPMAASELAELIAEVAPGAPSLRLEAAAASAAGSPYLAELIGRELAETGAVDPRNSEVRRLARLTDSERSVTELTALATSGTTFEQLQALVELPSARLASVLRALEDARIIKISPSASGEPVYALYHQRMRDAARGAIASETRRAMHLRFARLGERDRAPPEQLAHHFEQAGERAAAARWSTAAADAAHTQLAWGVAADWYRRAIALGAAACRQQLADCLFLGGKLAEAADMFEQLAAETAGDAGEQSRVRAAEAYIKLGELDRGLAILDGVLDRRGEPRAHGRVASTARTLVVAARWLLPSRRPPAAAPSDPVLAAAYRVIASFLSTPYPIESFEYVLRGIALAERAGDRDARGLGMAMLAAYLGVGSLGRFGDRAIAAAHRLSTESGAPYPRMVAAGAAGILATLRGDWAGMRRAHDEGHRICMRLGLQRSWEASFLRTYQALGEYYAGEPDRALAILYELADASDELFSRAMLGSYRGRALLLGGNLAAARAQEQELERSPATQRGLAAIYRQVFQGELALAEHDWVRAEAIGHELARSARAQWLTAMPAVSAMIDNLLATAELGRGDRASAARARRRARALHRRARVSFYAATALRLWGQAELRLGNTGAANMILARASAVAAKRGGKVDRLAISGLLGTPVAAGPLAFAVRWNTGGMV